MANNLKQQTQLLVIHGSRAYGLNNETSDVDVKGFFIPELKSYFSPFYKIEQVVSQIEINDNFFDSLTEDEKEISSKEKLEGCVFEMSKFINLLRGMNPSVIEILFGREEEIRICTDIGRELIENRNMFLSQKAAFTYSDYACAQIKRIQSHKKWLLDPKDEKPQRTDDKTEYKEAKREHKQFQEWKNNRNPARAELEKKYGYDTKHAMHLVRLLRTGIEVLETGTLKVYRNEDRDLLLKVRAGEWAFEKLIEWAEEKQKETMDFYNSNKSPLPKQPDEKKIDDFAVELFYKHFGVKWNS